MQRWRAQARTTFASSFPPSGDVDPSRRVNGVPAVVASQDELWRLFDNEDGDEGELGADSADERHWIRLCADADARYFVETSNSSSFSWRPGD